VDKNHARPGPIADKARISARPRPRYTETMRRNVAIQLSRRETGGPRLG